MKKFSVCILVCLLMMSICSVAFAAKKTGSLQPEDFAFKGVALGDTSAVMQEKLGEPDFDTEIVVLEQAVKCYVYSADLKVCVDPRTEKVVAVLCKDKEYKARAGVSYGATRAKLNNVYGEAEHRQIGGLIYYIYRNPENQQQRLMVQIDNDHLYAKAWTVSVLPLDEEEAMDFAENDKFTAGWRDNEGPRFQYHLSKNVTIGN